MYSSKHLGFPVIERDTLVGMVTLADVNRTSSIDREAMQVRDIMSRDPITLPPTAPVIDALKIMSARNIGRIPVVQDGKIVGIVTRTDILKVTELKDLIFFIGFIPVKNPSAIDGELPAIFLYAPISLNGRFAITAATFFFPMPGSHRITVPGAC